MNYVGENHTRDTLDIINRVNRAVTSKKSTHKLVGFKRTVALVVMISMTLVLTVTAFDVLKIIDVGIYTTIKSAFTPKPKQLDKGDINSKPQLDKGVKDADVSSGAINMANYDEIKAGLQAKTDASYVNYRINSNPIFQNGKGNVLIQNSASNTGLLQVEILRESDNVILYKSPVLKPNEHVENGEIYTKVKSGEYPAIAMFRLYNAETESLMGETGIKIKVTVR